MSDPFKPVRPGQPFRLPAPMWNAALGMAREAHGGQLDGGPPGGINSSPLGYGIVRVVNETGTNLQRHAVVGLDGPIFTPTDDEAAFLREVTFRGVDPTSGHVRGKFAVLAEPARAGQVVRAFVAGVYQARVDVTDPAHTCCVADVGNTDALVSGETGAAEILWREGDGDPGYSTGVQWAVVRRAASCPQQQEEEVPLDEHGCCDFIPTDGLPGSVSLTTNSGTFVFGDWTYDARAAQVFYARHEFIHTSKTSFGLSQGHYVSGPICVQYTQAILGGTRYWNVRTWAVLGCSTAGASGDAATPRVRLFFVSNYGQFLDFSGSFPSTCDDNYPQVDATPGATTPVNCSPSTPLYDCVPTYQVVGSTVQYGGKKIYLPVAAADNDIWAVENAATSASLCAPLCLAFDAEPGLGSTFSTTGTTLTVSGELGDCTGYY